jgi:predicted amidohydrolase YtcJ
LNAQRRIQLNNKVLAPGFIDAHNHFMIYCMWLPYLDCRLPLNGDMDELLEKISSKAEELSRGEWVKGWGFADYKVKQRRFPTLAELDKVALHNPVGIIHVSGHSAVVNSKGLEYLGITKQTPDPSGGKIERDKNTGQPNGVLHETAMLGLSIESTNKEFVALNADKQMEAIRAAAEEYAQMGITTTCDALSAPDILSIYQSAEKKGVLKCRVVAMPYYDSSASVLESGLRSGFGSEMFRLGPMKLFGDGSLSGRTAAVSIPYQDSTNTGILYRSQEVLDDIINELDKKDFQIAVHAIGDRAVEQVINSYQKVLGKDKQNIKRHRIEHAGILNPDLIKSMADLDLVVAVQPRMLYEQGDGFFRSCGEERIQWVYPYRELIEHGIHVAGSSDCPVVSPDPILGMRDSIMRKTEEGRVLAPSQRLDADMALRMYTKEAAFSIFEENNIGTIEEGKLADMVGCFIRKSLNHLSSVLE